MTNKTPYIIIAVLLLVIAVMTYMSCNKPVVTDHTQLDSLQAVIFRQADSLKNNAIGDTVYIHVLDSLRNPVSKLKIIYINEREKEHNILNGDIDTNYYQQQLDSLTR